MLRPTAVAPSRFELLLRRDGVLSSLGPEAIRLAALEARAQHFERGECVWRAGDKATHFQVVVSGIVKLVAPGVALRPSLIEVFGPGESVGYWAALDGSPYIGDAMPLTEKIETLLIPATVLCQAVQKDHGAALAMLHALLAHSHALRNKIGVMGAGSVHQRLAMLLLDLNKRFGDINGDGWVIVPVPLNRQDLAMWVGATIETVIRVMSRWQKDSLVETHPWGFLLRDVSRLGSLLDSMPARTAKGCAQAREVML